MVKVILVILDVQMSFAWFNHEKKKVWEDKIADDSKDGVGLHAMKLKAFLRFSCWEGCE